MIDSTIVDLVAAQVRDRLGRNGDDLNERRRGWHCPPLVLVDLAAEPWTTTMTFLRAEEVALGYSQIRARDDGDLGFYHSSTVIADRLATALATTEGMALDARCHETGNADSGTNLVDAYLNAVWHTTEVTAGRWDAHPAGTSMGVRYAEAFSHLASFALGLAEILTWIDGTFTFTYSPDTIGS